MGFGIIILGYILTLLDTFGGGIVGCPLMAYGFYRASRVNTRFGICSIISLISLYEPVLQVMAIFKVINNENVGFMRKNIPTVISGERNSRREVFFIKNQMRKVIIFRSCFWKATLFCLAFPSFFVPRRQYASAQGDPSSSAHGSLSSKHSPKGTGC